MPLIKYRLISDRKVWFQNRRAKWRKQEKSTGAGGSSTHGYNPYSTGNPTGPTVLPSQVIQNNMSAIHGSGGPHHSTASAAALSAVASNAGALFGPHAALAAAYRKPMMEHPGLKSSGYLSNPAMFNPNSFNFANASAFPFRELSAAYPQLFPPNLTNPSAGAMSPFANPFLSPYANASNSFQSLLASLSSSHNRPKMGEETGLRNSSHFMNVQQNCVERQSPPLRMSSASPTTDNGTHSGAAPDRRNTSIAALRLKAREHEMAVMTRKDPNSSSSSESSVNNGTENNA